MNINTETIVLIIKILILIDVGLLLTLILNKAYANHNAKSFDALKNDFIKNGLHKHSHKNIKQFLYLISSLKQTVVLDTVTNKTLNKAFYRNRNFSRSLRGLKSVFKIKRINSAVNLGAIGGKTAVDALETALMLEKSYPIKLYIANALSDIGAESSIGVLIDSLLGAHRWYRSKVNILLTDFSVDLQNYFPVLKTREEIEIKELLVDFASTHICEDSKQYLFKLIDTLDEEKEKLKALGAFPEGAKYCANCRWGRIKTTNNKRLCKYKGIVSENYSCHRFNKLYANLNAVQKYEKLVYKAAEIAAQFYFNDLTKNKYLNADNQAIRNIAVKALGNINSTTNIFRLRDMLSDETVEDSAVFAITKIIEQDPVQLNYIIEAFSQEKDEHIKIRLAEVLAGKIEYLVMKLETTEKDNVAAIIKQLVLRGRTAELIGFMNKNKEKELENILVKIIKQVIREDKSFEKEFCMYLKENILQKAGLLKCERFKSVKENKKPNLIKVFYGTMIILLLVFPLIYCIRHWQILMVWPLTKQLETYIIDFNYYLAFYFIVINIIYLFLLIFARINVYRQTSLWRCKSYSMLFKKICYPGYL